MTHATPTQHTRDVTINAVTIIEQPCQCTQRPDRSRRDRMLALASLAVGLGTPASGIAAACGATTAVTVGINAATLALALAFTIAAFLP